MPVLLKEDLKHVPPFTKQVKLITLRFSNNSLTAAGDDDRNRVRDEH